MERGTWKHGFSGCEGSDTNLHADRIGLGKWLLWQKNREGVSFSCQRNRSLKAWYELTWPASLSCKPDPCVAAGDLWGPTAQSLNVHLSLFWKHLVFPTMNTVFTWIKVIAIYFQDHMKLLDGGEAGESQPPQVSAAHSQRDHTPFSPQYSVLQD